MICCIIQKVNSLQHRTQILRYKFNNSENFVNYQFSSVFYSKTKHWSEPCHGMAWGIVPIYNMDHIRKRGNLYKVHFVASVHHLRKCCVNVIQRSQYGADGCITMVLWVYVHLVGLTVRAVEGGKMQPFVFTASNLYIIQQLPFIFF